MPIEPRPATRYNHGVTMMRPREVDLIIGNDTRTQERERTTAPQPQHVGRMKPDEVDAVIADGFTPIRQHRKSDFLQIATRAIAEVVASFTRPVGTARLHNHAVTIEGQRSGRRIVTIREEKSDAYSTVRAGQAKRGVQPADLVKIKPDALRRNIPPDHRQKGLPTIQSLLTIATSSADAEHFVRLRGGDQTHQIPKAPLKSMRHEQQVKEQDRRPIIKADVTKSDGVPF